MADWRVDANFDPRQLDPVPRGSQIEVGWVQDLNPVRVNDLTIENVVGERDVVAAALARLAYARGDRSRTADGEATSSQRAPITPSLPLLPRARKPGHLAAMTRDAANGYQARRRCEGPRPGRLIVAELREGDLPTGRTGPPSLTPQKTNRV